ncbi:hypothetical protein AAFF_G00167080 [Aldrovandia affinis]|uniref:Uncharacterized protein n=1 Tax=Aldrovandia affinis TaxID=143900 RepID=A0AAD7W8G6_9TELE|nr:hypothetical protein AAFF_G00167080 [Aldrovandia affinis]
MCTPPPPASAIPQVSLAYICPTSDSHRHGTQITRPPASWPDVETSDGERGEVGTERRRGSLKKRSPFPPLFPRRASPQKTSYATRRPDGDDRFWSMTHM